MRSKRSQLASLIRIVVVLSALVALVAATSGLLLAVHLRSFAHPKDHDPQNCSFCRHVLIPSKKFLPGPHVEVRCEVGIPWAVPLAPTPPAPACHPRASQPRAPPGQRLDSWA
jgi:hypothetical protein